MLRDYIENENKVERGDLFYANLPLIGGSVQAGERPVIIVQNNIGNKYSPNVIVVPLTSQTKKAMPTHVGVSGCGLTKESTALCEQFLTIPRTSLVGYIGRLTSDLSNRVDTAMRVSICLP